MLAIKVLVLLSIVYITLAIYREGRGVAKDYYELRASKEKKLSKVAAK